MAFTAIICIIAGRERSGGPSASLLGQQDPELSSDPVRGMIHGVCLAPVDKSANSAVRKKNEPRAIYFKYNRPIRRLRFVLGIKGSRLPSLVKRRRDSRTT